MRRSQRITFIDDFIIAMQKIWPKLLRHSNRPSLDQQPLRQPTNTVVAVRAVVTAADQISNCATSIRRSMKDENPWQTNN